MNMAELMAKARIVELNNIIYPGKENRRLEIRQQRVFTGEFMFEVDTLSHIGAHAEAPSHFMPALKDPQPGKDVSEFPPEKWMGEAVFVDLKDLKPGDPITVDLIKNFDVKKDDIVVIGNAPVAGGAPGVGAAAGGAPRQRPLKSRMTAEAAKYLADVGIKMIGLDWSFNMEPGNESLEAMKFHVEMLGHDIPMIEGLCYLDQLKEHRFFLIALPYRVAGCDSWPVRAIALEGVL
jgi:kynurenine formamidase